MTSEECFRANPVTIQTPVLWKGNSSPTGLGAALLTWTRNFYNRCWKLLLDAWSFGTPDFFDFFFFLRKSNVKKPPVMYFIFFPQSSSQMNS